MPHFRAFLLVAMALPLSACGVLGGIWGGEDGEEKAQAEVAVEPAAVQVPVDSVERVEIGRTRDGFLITAYGTAPALGYSLPHLVPRRGGMPGADGYVEYDFVASQPPPGFDLPAGTSRTRALRADLAVEADALRGAAGIRVLGLRSAAQLDFGPPPQGAPRQS